MNYIDNLKSIIIERRKRIIDIYNNRKPPKEHPFLILICDLSDINIDIINYLSSSIKFEIIVFSDIKKTLKLKSNLKDCFSILIKNKEKISDTTMEYMFDLSFNDVDDEITKMILTKNLRKFFI